MMRKNCLVFYRDLSSKVNTILPKKGQSQKRRKNWYKRGPLQLFLWRVGEGCGGYIENYIKIEVIISPLKEHGTLSVVRSDWVSLSSPWSSVQNNFQEREGYKMTLFQKTERRWEIRQIFLLFSLSTKFRELRVLIQYLFCANVRLKSKTWFHFFASRSSCFEKERGKSKENKACTKDVV